MFESHQGALQLKHKFQKTYDWLEKRGPSGLMAKRGTNFVEQAEITQKGPHSGEEVMRFIQDGKEYGRTYECCCGHYYNCNRTRIGMYCAAVDIAFE